MAEGGEHQDDGTPVAYTGLQPGTPVQAADGQPLGTVRAVLAVEDMDVFDGVVVDTEAGVRFIDAPEIGRIYTTRVETTLTADQAAALPEPDRAQFQRIRPGDRVGRSLLGRLFGGR